MKWRRTKHAGIQVRHKLVGRDRKPCPADEGGRCRCEPSYRYAYRPLLPDGKAGPTRYSKVFRNLDECRGAQLEQKRRQGVVGPTGDTFRSLWSRWLEGASSGQISARGKERKPYGARTLNIYRRAMEGTGQTTGVLAWQVARLRKPLGDVPAEALSLADWQAVLDGLRRERGLSHNSLQTIFNAVRAVYRWACAPARGLLALNAVHGLEMPAKDEKARDRIAPPDEARRLLAALNTDPRCFPYDVLDFALALYAGMRNIERWGLKWDRHVLVDGKPTRVSITRDITKSAAGVRTLPVIALLRPILMREWLRQGKPTSGPVLRTPQYGTTRKIKGKPTVVYPSPMHAYGKQAKRVAKAWADAGLERITPHSMRHTFASYLIGSGLNAKAVTVLMGHSSIEITFDRYGHLFPGHEDEAAKYLDAYLGQPANDEDAING